MTVERFPVEAGHVSAFRRAIGEDVVASIDDSDALLAPLTFVEAAAHFDDTPKFRPLGDDPWMGSGRLPSGLDPADLPAPGGMHAEQTFEYHRPLAVGDVLHSIPGPARTWSKAGRSGTLEFHETTTEFRDESDELVISTRRVVVHVQPLAEAPIATASAESGQAES